MFIYEDLMSQLTTQIFFTFFCISRRWPSRLKRVVLNTNTDKKRTLTVTDGLFYHRLLSWLTFWPKYEIVKYILIVNRIRRATFGIIYDTGLKFVWSSMTVNTNKMWLPLCQTLSDVEDARKNFVPGISWHCFYFWVFMHKTIGSELPPSHENTVLEYELFHLW